MSENKYNYIDFFSGVGGFHLGSEWAGLEWNKSFSSEIEKYPISVYQKRFPDSIPLGDITKIDCDLLIKEYGTRWIITSGFP